MPSQDLAYSEFQSFIESHSLVFVDFWAPWCAPCKQFSWVYDAVAKQFPAVEFVQVNIEEQKEWAEAFSIQSIPHLMVFKEGLVIYSDAGSISEPALRGLVEQALAVQLDC